MDTEISTTQPWSLWRKFIFRFFFILILLMVQPWAWFDDIPGVHYISDSVGWLMDKGVYASNNYIFHVKDELVPTNGSGDTSYGWALLWMTLLISFAGGFIWSLFDRKRPSYTHLNYWLCLFARYFVAIVALGYGIDKLFALQMPFPNLHQLATPLGDFLPMRLSWMFIGYSSPYQVFSGIMEIIAGLLLLYRRTATMGILFATCVFINVALLNLSYDIPVKIFSLSLVMICFFLLANESRRIICFFVLNKPAPPCELYHFRYTTKRLRIARWIFKGLIIVVAVILPFINAYNNFKSVHAAPKPQPVQNGVYTVTMFSRNHDSASGYPADSLDWKDVIFENGFGSMQTADTAFRHRYHRAYFNYYFDSVTKTLAFKKSPGDSLPFAHFLFQMPDSATLLLTGKQSSDSLFIELRQTNRHFQLAEKQFHWLTEYNR